MVCNTQRFVCEGKKLIEELIRLDLEIVDEGFKG